MALILAVPAQALAPDKSIAQYVHDVWRNVDGLPQNTVTAIAQTPNGYLWLGTLEGLVRFDGAQFELFNTRNTPGFAHNIVVALLVDSQGRLWIGTSGGGLMRYEGRTFQQWHSEDGLPSEQIAALHEDDQGRIWIGTDGGGLAYIERDRVTTDSAYADIGRSVRALAHSAEGLWVGSDAGLTLIRPNGAQDRTDDLAGIRALLVDQDGAVWISSDDGLYRRVGGQIVAVDDRAGKGNDIITAMYQDRDRNLWLASDGGGLLRWQHDEFSSFTSRLGLSNDAVLSVFASRDGSLWVGTNLGGLNRFKDGRLTTFTVREGLTHDSIRSVYEDRAGTLWVGTEGGGLVKYRGGTFGAVDGLPGDTVYALLESSLGGLWVGTDKGLARRVGDRWETFDEALGLSGDFVLALHEDRDGVLWVGTYAGGLKRFADGAVTSVTTADGLGANTVNVLLEDRQGALWIGTRGGGLSRLFGGKVESFTTADGLADDQVFSLYEDVDGSLWIGTYGGGVTRYKNGRFATVTEAHGLFDNVVHRIVDDGQGHFWMSSNRGIARVRRSELAAIADGRLTKLSATVFGVGDGMHNVECNGGANAGVRSANGDLWFPSVQGLVRVAAQQGRAVAQPVTAMIADVRVDGQSRQTASTLSLGPDAKNLEIHYTATDLFDADKLRFRYRLHGVDDDWVDAGTRRTAYYSRLPAGDYRFELRLYKDASGTTDSSRSHVGAGVVESGRPATRRSSLQAGFVSVPLQGAPPRLDVSIAPRLVETNGFRALAIACLALLVYGAFRLRLHHLTGRTRKLERVVAARTAELEAANKRLSRLAKEDSLTGLLNRRAFDEQLGEECRRASRTHTPLALLLLDIDFFKQYNDAYGHQAGDECLRSVAETLAAACGRAGEVVARYGGEEFAIILPGVDGEQAMRHAETLRALVERLTIRPAGNVGRGQVTASIGVASSVPSSQMSPEDLIADADEALYSAKATGRNRWMIATRPPASVPTLRVAPAD